MIRVETHVVHKTMFIDDEEQEVAVTMDIIVETPSADSPGGSTLREWSACDDAGDEVEIDECDVEQMAGDAISSGRFFKCSRPMTRLR
jgi:hypothetical protein